jgi:glycerophosphoryl diester phosphodiesterase
MEKLIKKISVLGILLGISLMTACQTRIQQVENTVRYSGSFSEELFQTVRNPENKRVFVVAHRGDWRNVPENSIASIENCIKMGIDMVEIDVRRSVDGHFVLMHDETVNRTTDGKGKVSALNLKELKNLKLINAQGEITQYNIPTLEEALVAAKGNIMLNLDKVFDYFPEIYPLIAEQKMEKQILLKSSLPAAQVLELLGDMADEILFMPVINLKDKDFEQKVSDYRRQLDPVGYELLFRSDKNEKIGLFPMIREMGSGVWVNTLWSDICGGHHDARSLDDPDGSWGWLLNRDVNIIQTDRPEELLQYLESRGLR